MAEPRGIAGAPLGALASGQASSDDVIERRRAEAGGSDRALRCMTTQTPIRPPARVTRAAETPRRPGAAGCVALGDTRHGRTRAHVVS
jgi:hypothetical protein